MAPYNLSSVVLKYKFIYFKVTQHITYRQILDVKYRFEKTILNPSEGNRKHGFYRSGQRLNTGQNQEFSTQSTHHQYEKPNIVPLGLTVVRPHF